MEYTDKERQKIAEQLEGCDPNDIGEVFYNELVTLLNNDPNYFANGRGNSLAQTLEATSNLVRKSSEVTK